MPKEGKNRREARIMITGGGSGGHIYPLVSVVAEIQILSSEIRRKIRIDYLGAYGPYKNLLEENGLKVWGIVGAKLRRYFSLRNFIDGPLFALSLIQALFKTFLIMPDVVFSKGGPGALAVILAARFYRIPVIIHESDAVPGLTNVLSARFAEEVATSFPSTQKYFGAKSVLTGNPIRSYLLGPAFKEGEGDVDEKRLAREFLKFDVQKPLVLFLGGSQGSIRLNDFVLKNLKLFLSRFQIFHQTGKQNYESVLSRVGEAESDFSDEEKKSYRIIDYFEKDVRIALRAADLVVGRAGSGSIFEIAAFGRPAILIPLPEAAQNHQMANAKEYAASGAAEVIEEADLNADLFLKEAIRILTEKEVYNPMSEAALRFSKPKAAEELAKLICSKL